MNIQEVPEYTVKRALRLGADDVVVSSMIDKTNQIKFVNNEIVLTSTWDTVSSGIFLTKDKKVVSTNIKQISQAEIDKTISKLLKFANLIEKKEDYFGIASGAFEYRKIPDLYDSRIEHLGDRSIDLVGSAIGAALKNGARRATGILDFGTSEIFLNTSGGVSVSDKGTDISLSIRSFTTKDASGHKISCGRKLPSLKPVWAGAESGRIDRHVGNFSIGRC